MKTMNITLPFTAEQLSELKSGDMIYLSGYVYTARDAAHVRIYESLMEGKCDINLKNEVIYYVGPTPKFNDFIIGSAGPTTSSRMDKYTQALMNAGLKATIGKGQRDKKIIDACINNNGLYLITTGGVGALLSNKIEEVEEILYKDLGPESIKRLKIKDFPVYVAYDTYGNDIFNLD